MEKNIDYWGKVEKAPTKAYKKYFQFEKEYLLEHVSKNSSVLDIACGDGRTIMTLLEETQNITGIDNDAKAIQEASSRLKHEEGVLLAGADATDIPFEAHTFDYVTLMLSFSNFDSYKNVALSEIERVLKPDGKLFLSCYSDTAIKDRIEMYKIIEIPIESIVGNKFIFKGSDGSIASEGFSEKEISSIVAQSNMKIIEANRVGDLALFFSISK
ncbi:MAG: SAM-dependent methyltransferase [Flavobacteriaceae bacterium]|jgi:SAM-dependent methyltransferase